MIVDMTGMPIMMSGECFLMDLKVKEKVILYYTKGVLLGVAAHGIIHGDFLFFTIRA